MSETLVIELSNNHSELARLATAIETIGEQEDWDPALLYKVNLALEELVLNVFTHGAHQDLKEVQVAVDSDTDVVSVRITDNGVAFDPLNDAPEPDLLAAIDDRQVGGLGVHLVLEMMDQVQYERIDDKNCLTLTLLRDG